jgi:hypothetical protein
LLLDVRLARFHLMESPEHERDAIESYMEWQAPDEKIIHLEKVTSERVMGRDRDVWDVHRQGTLVGHHRAD